MEKLLTFPLKNDAKIRKLNVEKRNLVTKTDCPPY